MLNVVALMGRLSADPELRQTNSGRGVTSFTIACDRSYAKAGTERQTDWIDCVAWGNTAEFICKYFKKGRQIAIEGSLQTRNWEDKQGNKRKSTEVIVSNASFVDSKSSQQGGQGGYSAPAAAPQQYSAPAPSFSQGNADDFAVIDDNEDLPF